MSLSKRDQKIVYGMAIALVSYAFFEFGLRPLWDQYDELKTQLDQAEEKFNSNLKMLGDRKIIEGGYKRVEAQFAREEADAEKDPEDEFSEDVVNLATAALGRQPSFEPVQVTAMPNVKGYLFYTFTIHASGELGKVAGLLKTFDSKGFLVKNTVISKGTGIGSLDSPDLSIDMTLARIVKEPSDEDETNAPGGFKKPSLGGRRAGGAR